MATNKPLDLALTLAGKGYKVFPCSAEKIPLTEHGYKDGTSDPAAVRELWARLPGELVGIACVPSGIFAVDIDRKNDVDGLQSWRDMVLSCADNGQFKHSGPAQVTHSKGYHLVFRMPANVNIPNNTGTETAGLAPGLDLRSNGYICTGQGYTTIDGCEWDKTPTDAPAWLLERIRAMSNKNQPKPATRQPIPAAPADAAAYWYNRFLPEARNGSRNNTLYRMGLQLNWSAVPDSEAEALALNFAHATGLAEREALATMQSAYKAPKKDPANIPGRSNGHQLQAPEYYEPNPAELEHQAPGEELIAPAAGAGQPAGEESILLTAPGDHEGHALCVLASEPDKFVYVEAFGWLYYNGKCHQREGAEAYLDRAIVKVLRTRRALAAAAEKYELVKACKGTSGNLSGTKDLLKSKVIALVDEFDNDPDMLNCGNGVLNLMTGELQPHSPKHKYTYVLPVDYDQAADRGPWLNFLRGALTTPEMVDYLQAAIGYSLTGRTWEEIMFYLFGPPRSGKGTFTETIITMLGQPLATEADFATFTAERNGDTQNFDLAPLKPCRFVAAGESNKNQPLNPAKIKALTGRNYVRCAYKHRDHFTYQPAFKIWLSSNHPVNVDVDDDAAWGRVRVIEFPHSHLGTEDKSLKARLTTPGSLQGVLAWAVEGARLWYELFRPGAGLPTPQAVADATQGQRDQRDFVKQFLTECFDDDPAGFVRNPDMYQTYKAWCEDNGVMPKHQAQLSAALKNKGYTVGQKKILGANTRGVFGLKTKVTGNT